MKKQFSHIYIGLHKPSEVHIYRLLNVQPEYVVLNDVCFLTEHEAEVIPYLQAIAQGEKFSDIVSDPFLKEKYLKSEEEIRAIFSENQEWVQKSVEIAKLCQLQFEFPLVSLPVYPLPEKLVGRITSFEYLSKLCFKGAEKRYQENRLFTVNNFEKNITAYNKLSSRYTSRYELFSKIREVYPEFGQNMNKKISSDDFQLYSQVLRNFKKVTSSIMEYTDTLPASDVLLNQQDKIAEVVDSIDFTRACEIEDKFMISELDTFFKNLSSMPPEVKHGFQKHNILMPDGKKSSYLELAQKVKNDRLKRIEKYGKIYKIYNKLKEHPYIRIEYDDKETR